MRKNAQRLFSVDLLCGNAMGCTLWMTFFGFVTLTFELDLDIISHDLHAEK